jgi:MFS transporter, Spinster family, sphingosine-1-phosphate transporter
VSAAGRYRNYLLVLLLVIFAFNQVDRWALGLVLQDIKVELSLSDTQLGLLTGIAFALFYSAMGLPIARWADRGNRVAIVSLSTALWSCMVALCSMVGNFQHLLLIRMGTAVGEAGCIPPAHSLIADYFTRAERPRAMALYMLGSPLSLMMGYFLAGWLNEACGWRLMFLILGLPGLALAALAWLTLREPRCAGPAPHAAAAAQPALKEVSTTLWANATFRHLVLGFAVIAFFGNGMGQWQPTFFIRSYGLSTAEIGAWFAAVYGAGSLLGTYLGGELACRFAAHNEQLQLRAMAVAYSSFASVYACIYLSSNHYLALGLLTLTAAGGGMAAGPLFATIQSLVPERMRALSIAVIFLFANLIGMGLGPLAVGVLSDVLRLWLADESLRYALLALSPGYIWGGWHVWRASQTVTHDINEISDI